MKKYFYITIISLAGIFCSSCEDFLEPEVDNLITEETLKNSPAFAEGFLIKAYVDLPRQHNFGLEAATDDAVTNNFNSEFWRMANGQWTAENSPISNWSRSYENIFYINSFLDIVDEVKWDLDSEYLEKMHRQRLRGEAYGLRAWYEFALLRSHAGPGPDDILLGYPVIREVLGAGSEWRIPRSSFEECVEMIIKDCNAAIANLPDKYVNNPGNDEFNQTMGERWTNRFTANAAKALKSRLLLYAASPVYNKSNDIAKWEKAARAAGQLISENGGTSSLSPTGKDFYLMRVQGASIFYDPEIIWASGYRINNVSADVALEERYYPPSLFGKAEVNPTQELVDAFPMNNGFPITNPGSGFLAANPYNNRDPRLEAYILFDSITFGAKGIIRTYQGFSPDGINEQSNSTRTGYYLRKFLNPAVTVFPTPIGAIHFYTYLRYTEVFLNYAEAANEAWGPDGTGEFGFSARDAIAAIRQRAGINPADTYLASLSSKEEFRALIRNERRIELCFEGHRFYDIRRWDDKDLMKAPVSGVFATLGFPMSYEYEIIENRNFQDFMIYGPVPYREVLKYDELKQNLGW
jgi:starch-binding outer membrane protein, SusD/RagB family